MMMMILHFRTHEDEHKERENEKERISEVQCNIGYIMMDNPFLFLDLVHKRVRL